MVATFSDLRKKEIINVCDGRRLGCPIDLELNFSSGQVIALIAPGQVTLKGFFQKCESMIIPWQRIVRIGDDVILVNLDPGVFHGPMD